MFNLTRRQGLYSAGLALAAFTCWIVISVPGAPAQNPKALGSVHGYVATVLSPQVLLARSPVASRLAGPSGISLGSPIFLPDIEAWTRNVRSEATSKHVVTNPQGYFFVTDLTEGVYQVCVRGSGYTSRCDDHTFTISRGPVVLDHLVPIQPAASAIAGTVRLADSITPCFWFRPSIDPVALTAKVSLLDDNRKVVAGPVNGNNLGQYVLPTPASTAGRNLHAECEAASGDTVVNVQAAPVLVDVAINNHPPQILAMDFTKGDAGVRRVNPGDVVRVTVEAADLDGDALHYRWIDDSARNLGLPDAPSVDWPVLNTATLNTLHVQVSDGRGGIATLSRTLPSGPDAILFAGRVFDRQSLAGIGGATLRLNKQAATTDAAGNFQVSVPDAGQFILNVTKPGYALASWIYRTRATNVAIPLDAVQSTAVNTRTGGSIQFPPAGCPCHCKQTERGGERKEDKRHEDHDHDRDDYDKDDEHSTGCESGRGGGNLLVTLPPEALVDSSGAKYTGAASLEGFQYDLTTQNPIPGDFGAVYQGKAVRMATFGSFHLLARDAQGQPLKLAPNQKVQVSIPIQASQRALAPAVIPFFHYDEDTGTWIEDGTLTRSGNRYSGNITHFSAFNADTIFPGGACVKVVLDNSFSFPVTLDASYFDPSAGTFNHNGTQASDTTIGVERMRPNQNFTLTITDSSNPPAVVSVPLNSGPGLDPVQFPSGLDTDQVNFSHCNGPVQISNNVLPATFPYFLGKVFGGTIVDNSIPYQQVTDAQSGGTRDTLVHWKQTNGFPNADEATAIYFNNGDLKFGRDMHCRVTNTTTNALACYVSNFGVVGTDDAPTALSDAAAYEASGQVTPQPAATVTMEYDPVKGVQFWAYHGEVTTGGVSDGGKYFPNPALDDQGPKTMPDICMGCHQGTYSGSLSTGVQNAVFLPFDLDSFKDQTNQLFPVSHPSAALQQQFHRLNNMIANTSPPPAITQLVNQLWYPGGSAATVPFTFNQGAAQLSGTPFSGHEPLYDNVVKEVCRTCHVAIPSFPWNTFSLMQPLAPTIQIFACAPQMNMPNAEVPWKSFWQENRSSTLASELNFAGNGCPNH